MVSIKKSNDVQHDFITSTVLDLLREMKRIFSDYLNEIHFNVDQLNKIFEAKIGSSQMQHLKY